MAKEKTGATEERDAEVITPKQKFYVPELDRSIEAESLEEAVEIANKELNK